MSVDFIKFAFTAGELSPTLLGRPDLEKFDLGLETAHNWFVDYHGGLSTRPGLEFLDFIKKDNLNVVLWPFKFNPDIANTYEIMLGDQYIRFVQDGGYVLETAVVITAVSSATPGVVTTSGAHGYADGDWVKIGSRTFDIDVLSGTTFALRDPHQNNFSTTGGVAAALLAIGLCARIYTVVSPFLSADIPEIKLSQRLDTMRITHTNYAPRDLTRIAHTNWTLGLTVFGNGKTAPTGLSGTPSGAGAFGFIWAVTAVFADGTESSITTPFTEIATINFNATAGWYKYDWFTVQNAIYYNIYRSNLVENPNMNRGAALGYIGRSNGSQFTETNIVPNFTRSPPINFRPFDAGQITSVSITAAGAGYGTGASMSISGGGSGFSGYPIVVSGGSISGAVILKGGSGYFAPLTVSFSGGGAGAAAVATAAPLSGTWPAISARFQQRELYAATLNEPLTIWGSKPGRLNNFDQGAIVIDSDPFIFDLDSEESTPIRHMVSMRSGLLLLTNTGIWQLTGGGLNNAVTPTNALADPHSYTGVSKVPPLKIDTDLIYQESKGATIRQLSYNDFSKVYAGIDISILSSHFFTRTNLIVSWSFAQSPYSIVWACRADGSMLGFTIVKEQNVFAWTEHTTKGFLRNGSTLQENLTDRTYFITERMIGGVPVKYLERLALRDFDDVENAFCVDSGLQLGATYPAATIACSGASGSVIFTASAAIFSAGDVGKILRMSGGKARITGYTNTTHITGTVLRSFRKFYPETGNVLDAAAGTWTLDATVSSVTGLWHLEGEEVSILADGNVLPRQTVVGGALTLGRNASRVTAGLPYRCLAKTLPLTAPQTVIESRRKRIVGVAIRLYNSRGVLVGISPNNLYSIKERTAEIWGEPTELLTEMKHVPTQAKWDDEGSFYYVVDDPLPATILGYVLDTEVGDDKE